MPDSVSYPFALEVAKGTVKNHSSIHKFGENLDIDQIEEDIWDQGGTYVFTAAGGANYFISSSDNSDTQAVQIYILTEDSNGDWNREIFDVTLAGQTKTQIITPSGDKPIRIYRILNDNSSDLAGDLYVYEDDTVVAGVPQTATKIRAKVLIGNNQTMMAIYPVASNETAYMFSWNASLSKRQVALARAVLFIRSFGSVFKAKEPISLNSAATSYVLRKFDSLEVVKEKSDIVIRSDSSVNNIGVAGGFDMTTISNDT